MGQRKRVCIVYHGTNHGTNLVNARKILKEGFKKDTYFGCHLEDAVGYGGLYVFEVSYPVVLIPKNCWQFLNRERVLPEFIVRLTKYNRSKVIKDNIVLRHSVFISNSTKRETKYIIDHMKEDPSGYTEAELIAYGVKRG